MRRPRRRITYASAGLATAALVAGTVMVTSMTTGPERAEISLHNEAIAVTTGGQRVVVADGSPQRLVPGTRVLAEAADAAELAAGQRRWLETTDVPDIGAEYADLIETALLDLHTLTLDNGAAVAGWSHHWRYVWPRDAAFVVAALAAVGNPQEAAGIVHFLQDVQGEDGLFEARYLPDGSGEPPDDRGVQLDGTGWALWSAAQVAAALDGAERQEFLDGVRPLVDRSVAAIARVIDNEDALPPPSPDFWEVSESRLTLGTAAPLLAGLEAAVEIYAWLGEDAGAEQARGELDRFSSAVHTTFGPGYQRYADGPALDASVFYLLPPVAATAHPDVVEAWTYAVDEMGRPAGGLAPGGDWRDDGVSWTPHTAMYALTAAALGEEETARTTLTWLDQHRTALGALPEKVLADGRPAAVAPLAWTAAVVVLTAVQLAD